MFSESLVGPQELRQHALEHGAHRSRAGRFAIVQDFGKPASEATDALGEHNIELAQQATI